MWQAGGSPQMCRQCVIGVMAKSETDHSCKVSFCILDKAQRDLFPGQEGRGPSSCHIAVDHRGKGGVFYPTSARNPAELWSHSLEVVPKKCMELSFLSWPWGSRTQDVNWLSIIVILIGHYNQGFDLSWGCKKGK